MATEHTLSDAGSQHPDSSDGVVGASPAPTGYELLGEVGRGGMGTVYRARDLRLGREVAIKTIQDHYCGHDTARARFIAEARITGQLQHPGIPAVHELGVLADGRPFLAMKLVKGETLHELLRRRPDASHDRGRFIAIFEQICHAVGFAHAHRVIHRDLKPSNVMVGAYGEVQVMDWGLAKVLGQGRDREELEEDPLATAAAVTEIDTPDTGSATRTGSVLGTPAYIAPEQAGGEIRRLDPRSDVFGLGAILCQILTGEPPYRGKDANDTRLKAVRWELQEALSRLASCGAEPEWVALCQRCLAFQQVDRPEDGSATAQEVARIRQSAEERARRAELEQAETLVREAGERQRRRVLQAAGAAIMAVLLLGIAGTAIGLSRADAARRAEQMRAESELAARQRLAQIEKGVVLFSGLIRGLNLPAEQQGGPPLYEKLRLRAGKAADDLMKEPTGDPEAVARLETLLGESLRELGDPVKALQLLERARATREDLLGMDHADTLDTNRNLALTYLAVGKRNEAIDLLEQIRDTQVRVRGAEHPDTLATLNSLASVYLAVGDRPKAIALYEQVREAKLRRQMMTPSETSSP